MPRKIRELKAALARAGFREEPAQGKGSHAKWRHPLVPDPVVLSGHEGNDAKPYQEQEVREALRRLHAAQRKQQR